MREYEALAPRLAIDPSLLRGLRDRLEQNRPTPPRHLERAYSTMWEIHQRGESPRSFSVEPLERAREAERR